MLCVLGKHDSLLHGEEEDLTFNAGKTTVQQHLISLRVSP